MPQSFPNTGGAAARPGQPPHVNKSHAQATGGSKDYPQAPAIELPKGGGAIKGMGEKFAANPVTGTGSMSVPIVISPGRSGFGPQLSLSYDSGNGNDAFGFGWKLSLPSITRKTEKCLPLYRDEDESDVFVLSGHEDLIPVLTQVNGQWQRAFSDRELSGVDYRIYRYQPRVEGLFARIERWVNRHTHETHWRTITRDNVTTLYGKTANARIADPATSPNNQPARVFSWLISESYDDKGNAVVYEYKEENSDGLDLTQANERNRTEESRSVNRYIKHIHYGNRQSRLVQPDLTQAKWLFEAVFDYGEHHTTTPRPDDDGKWPCRPDPFSTYRPGFELRTYRLCQRVLLFHHVPEEAEVGKNCLVRSTDLLYQAIRQTEDDVRKGLPMLSFVASIQQQHYQRQARGYQKGAMPPLEFSYSSALIGEEVRELDAESLANLPVGLDDAVYQWVDLDGEGLSGILTEQGNAWYYKPNEGEGHFGPVQKVASRPSLVSLKFSLSHFKCLIARRPSQILCIFYIFNYFEGAVTY